MSSDNTDVYNIGDLGDRFTDPEITKKETT